MWRALAQRWFLAALLGVLAFGLTCADALSPLADAKWLQRGIVITVLFLMALPLQPQDLARSLRRPAPALLACGISMGLLPLGAWLLSCLLTEPLGTGLQVAAVVPCTLASAAVWTRRAGGNDAAAILVMLITNATCFVITPLWLTVMSGRTVQSPELSFSRMSLQLGLLVVLPMAVAQASRLWRPMAALADRRRVLLGGLAQCGILSMVFLGAIHSGLGLRRDGAGGLTPADLAAMLAAVLALHLAAMWIGARLARIFQMPRGDQIAVAFAGSQKTLMVGLVVAISTQTTILPIVAYQVLQLIVDTVIADRMRRQAAR